jgi:hypothetical protein
VGRAAGKAKVPLMAGGAALMGAAAGGLAVGARSRRAKGIAKAIPRRPLVKVPRRPLMKVARPPQIKVNSRDLKHAAKEVGAFGAQVGRVASELQGVREESNGKHGKHRSPVEVVLEGLTARR